MSLMNGLLHYIIYMQLSHSAFIPDRLCCLCERVKLKKKKKAGQSISIIPFPPWLFSITSGCPPPFLPRLFRSLSFLYFLRSFLLQLSPRGNYLLMTCTNSVLQRKEKQTLRGWDPFKCQFFSMPWMVSLLHMSDLTYNDMFASASAHTRPKRVREPHKNWSILPPSVY